MIDDSDELMMGAYMHDPNKKVDLAMRAVEKMEAEGWIEVGGRGLSPEGRCYLADIIRHETKCDEMRAVLRKVVDHHEAPRIVAMEPTLIDEAADLLKDTQ
jgi:hypothetical protein